jgi:putative NADPH-quinone reductase
VEFVSLRELEFAPVLRYGYRKRIELEPCLVRQQELLKWCDHWVLVTPLWWMGTPALLKGYFERVLLPGFAFRYHENDPFWDRLLARWDSFWRTLNQGTLGFCGFKPVRRTVFIQVKKAGEGRRKKWLSQVRDLGRRGA